MIIITATHKLLEERDLHSRQRIMAEEDRLSPSHRDRIPSAEQEGMEENMPPHHRHRNPITQAQDLE